SSDLVRGGQALAVRPEGGGQRGAIHPTSMPGALPDLGGTVDPMLARPWSRVRPGRTIVAMTTVLITGANRGLGFETARQLAGRGWTVLLGARDPVPGRTAAEKLAAGGGDVHHVPLDVTDDESVDAALDRVAAMTDHLDVLVNNAGIIGSPTPPLETRPADFLACFGVNLLGPVRVTRAFLPLLERAALPRIVMVSSGMG